jgi:hypothetical protein
MNRTELRDRLAEAGVPDSLYSIQGVHELPTYLETFYMLGGPAPDRVLVGVYERGRYRNAFESRDDEAACDLLWNELVFEEPEPEVLDEQGTVDAGARSAELVFEVKIALERAARTGDVASIRYELQPDDVVDRFGPESGSFLYPDGTPIAERALPPTAVEPDGAEDPDNYHRYRVLKALPVRAGVAAPAFEQPGGGVMFKLDPEFLAPAPAMLTVRWLLHHEYLRRVF